jgi:hypothetical protein
MHEACEHTIMLHVNELTSLALEAASATGLGSDFIPMLGAR